MTNQPLALFPKLSSPLPTPSPSGHTAVDSTSATGFTEVAEPGRLTYQAAQAAEGGEPPSGVSEAYGEGAGGGRAESNGKAGDKNIEVGSRARGGGALPTRDKRCHGPPRRREAASRQRIDQ